MHAVLLIDGGMIIGTESLFTPGGLAGVTVLEMGTVCDEIADLRPGVARRSCCSCDVTAGEDMLRAPTR